MHWYVPTEPNAVPFNCRTFARQPLHHVLMWLLALVLPLQGMAVGVFTVMGATHIHQPVDVGVSLVLTDFRRWKSAPVREPGVFAFLTHSHKSAAPQRHPHARGDTSIVRTGDDSLATSADVDVDEGLNASATLASVLALMSAAMSWTPSAPDDSLAWRPLWSFLTGFTQPLEHPPRFG